MASQRIKYCHRNFRNILLKRIFSGNLKVGDALPARRELCRIYKVSYSTVNQVIKELCEEGYLTAVHGVATTVRSVKAVSGTEGEKYQISLYSPYISVSDWQRFAAAHSALGDFFPCFASTYHQLLSEECANPLVNFLYTSDGLLAPMVQRKLLAPLNEFVESNILDTRQYHPRLLELMSRDGKLYALPLCFATSALFYNKELFDREKVAYPTDDMPVSDFMRLVERMSRHGKDGKVEHYGLLYFFEVSRDLLSYPLGGGEREKREYLETIQFLIDNIRKQRILATVSSNNSAVHEIFRRGQCAMMIGRYQLTDILNRDSSRFGVATRAGIRRLPSVCATQGIGLNRQSAISPGMVKTLNTLCGKDMQNLILKSSHLLPAFRRKSSQQFMAGTFIRQLPGSISSNLNYARNEDYFFYLIHQLLYALITPEEFAEAVRRMFAGSRNAVGVSK